MTNEPAVFYSGRETLFQPLQIHSNFEPSSFEFDTFKTWVVSNCFTSGTNQRKSTIVGVTL